MGVAAVRLYSDLCKAPDDESKARLIAEAFEMMEHRYPEVKDLATQSALRETELRLQLEIRETEGRLQLEIEKVRQETEQIRHEIRETESRLQLEIEKVRQEIKETEGRLQLEIKAVEVRLVTTIHRQTVWVIGAVGAILGILKFLDVVLK